jgi:hypothetical protein
MGWINVNLYSLIFIFQCDFNKPELSRISVIQKEDDAISSHATEHNLKVCCVHNILKIRKKKKKIVLGYVRLLDLHYLLVSASIDPLEQH